MDLCAKLLIIPDVIFLNREVFKRLTKSQVGVIYDDRDMRPGEKFADADLLGIPYRVVISEKTVSAGTFELKARTAQEATLLSKEELIKTLAN